MDSLDSSDNAPPAPSDLQHWAIDVEVYNKEENYLAKAEGMVSHIRSGESKVQTLIILNTQSSAIKSYRVTLGAIVGYSGLREDKKYTLKLKDQLYPAFISLLEDQDSPRNILRLHPHSASHQLF